ncbi:MAG: hypothetical protein V1855_04875, partial [bacterium]
FDKVRASKSVTYVMIFLCYLCSDLHKAALKKTTGQNGQWALLYKKIATHRRMNIHRPLLAKQS